MAFPSIVDLVLTAVKHVNKRRTLMLPSLFEIPPQST